VDPYADWMVVYAEEQHRLPPAQNTLPDLNAYDGVADAR